MPVPQKAPFSGLLPFAVSRYSFIAVAKSTAGRRNPCNSQATPDAPCVFFLRRSSGTPIFRAVVFMRTP
ncbi:ash family protein [Klebsiella pneumoniae]